MMGNFEPIPSLEPITRRCNPIKSIAGRTALLDALAVAKQERDAAAVILSDIFVLYRGPYQPANAVN
jgi:hypothetical protein